MSASDEHVDPRRLVPHPLSVSLFGLGGEEEQQELATSLATEGVRRPLTVTGEGCAAGPNVVLGGCRRRAAAERAGLASVPVRRVHDLTVEEEEAIVIGENLADQLGRRLLESRRAALEHRILEQRRVGQGHRSDIGTSAGASGSREGDTRDVVAKELGVARNALADRLTIYFSPISPETLKDAVDAGGMSRTEAARLVREIEREPDVMGVLDEARRAGTPYEQITMLPPILAARAKVVEAMGVRHAEKKAKNTRRAPVTDEAEGFLVEGASEVDFLGRRVRVAVTEERVRIVNVGAAEGGLPESEYVWSAPTTRTSWVVDVNAVVEALPENWRASVTVADVETLDPVRCPSCAGTRFYRVGGCARCKPITLVDAQGIRNRVRAELHSSMCQAIRQEFRQSLEGPVRLADSGSEADREWARDRDVEKLVQAHMETIGREQAEAAVVAAYAAAAAVDPRMTQPYLGYPIDDLRHPRNRIKVSTPKGTLEVVLWERGNDYSSLTTVKAPRIYIGLGGHFVYLNAPRDPFSNRMTFRAVVADTLRAVLLSK